MLLLLLLLLISLLLLLLLFLLHFPLRPGQLNGIYTVSLHVPVCIGAWIQMHLPKAQISDHFISRPAADRGRQLSFITASARSMAGHPVPGRPSPSQIRAIGTALPCTICLLIYLASLLHQRYTRHLRTVEILYYVGSTRQVGRIVVTVQNRRNWSLPCRHPHETCNTT